MAKSKIFVGIETSCDDTCVAISKNNKILANVSSSSLKEHAKWGGVVPEIAARSHEKHLLSVYTDACKQAKINQKDITHVCYTDSPGLPGSLHVGKVFAKTISYLLNVPLIPINHLLGHVFSFNIESSQKIKFPLLACVLSGGHTCIYLFKSYTHYSILNETQDDAIGEALDKVGRMLKLSYPGGVTMDKLYKETKSVLKIINHYAPETPFSFSGAKTHMLNLINSLNMKDKPIDKVLLASSFLKWCIDEIKIKMTYYETKHKSKTVVFGGGVSMNHLLRKCFNNQRYLFPNHAYCTDNAAMICHYAFLTTKSIK